MGQYTFVNRWILFIVALACFETSCTKKPVYRPGPVEVTVFEVQPYTIPANFDYVGVAESSHPVEIRARVEGYIDKIAYVEGSFVHVGELLFQLDPRPFIAALDSEKGELAKQEAILWNAKVTTARLRPLYKEHAISERDLDNAIAQELAAEASVESAKANVWKAQLNLSYTHIESPIAGAAGRAQLREGALVVPGPNSLLTTVSVLDPIWIYFSVSDTDLLRAHTATKAKKLIYPPNMQFGIEVTLADGKKFPEKGYVDFTAPTLDQTTGTMFIRAVLANPDSLIRPGQFVRVTVTGAKYPDAIVVPQQAVLQGKKGMYVFVVDNEDAAQMRFVEPGDWFGNYWIINSGLNLGEKVVVSGVNKVQSDVPVTITKEVAYAPDEPYPVKVTTKPPNAPTKPK